MSDAEDIAREGGTAAAGVAGHLERVIVARDAEIERLCEERDSAKRASALADQYLNARADERAATLRRAEDAEARVAELERERDELEQDVKTMGLKAAAETKRSNEAHRRAQRLEGIEQHEAKLRRNFASAIKSARAERDAYRKAKQENDERFAPVAEPHTVTIGKLAAELPVSKEADAYFNEVVASLPATRQRLLDSTSAKLATAMEALRKISQQQANRFRDELCVICGHGSNHLCEGCIADAAIEGET